MFGANDWSWRAESGDWRFFYFDVPTDVAPGTLFLSDTTWNDTAPYTDLDTLIFGPSENAYQLLPPGTADGAPYILDTVGKSANTNTGAGVWTFQTATGGAEEVVAGPASGGLHALVQHGTGWSGDKFNVPFTSTLGAATVSPASVSLNATTSSGAFDVTFTSGVALPGLAADGVRAQPAVRDHRDGPSGRSQRPVHGQRQEVVHAWPMRPGRRSRPRSPRTTSTCTSSTTPTTTGRSTCPRSSARRPAARATRA